MLRRALEHLRARRGGYGIDPVTGGPWGALSLDRAVNAGIATVGRHSYGGLTFHNPGAPIPGLQFRILETE